MLRYEVRSARDRLGLVRDPVSSMYLQAYDGDRGSWIVDRTNGRDEVASQDSGAAASTYTGSARACPGSDEIRIRRGLSINIATTAALGLSQTLYPLSIPSISAYMQWDTGRRLAIK